jgi:hypothetical protein
MNFVPGYTHDVFVSYAQVDDKPDDDGEDGWVTSLIKRLQNRLAQHLGREDNFSLWYDHHLAHHVNITPEIMSRIDGTAALVVVFSPGYLASPWCGHERERFLAKVQECKADNGRVFLVERDFVERAERPAEFGDLLGYKFWVQNHEGTRQILKRSRSGRFNDEYDDRFDRLALELSEKLKALKKVKASEPSEKLKAPKDAARPDMKPRAHQAGSVTTVYLAEATDDLDTKRTKLIRNLQQRNLRVIPDVWYPGEPAAFRQAVESGLNEADLFVQLLSAAPGRKPPGLESGYVGFQHECAAKMGLPILQWRHPSLDVPTVESDVEDESHKKLLLGASVRAVDIEDFCREVIQQAELAEQERKQGPSPDAFVFVNVDLAQDDQATADELCRYFEKNGIEYALPIQSGEAKETQEDREAEMVRCDGMIVVHGRVSSVWVRRQLRDFRELAESRRKKSARALAIYQGPPIPKEALGTFLRDLMMIDCTGGIQEARLRPFLQALQQEVVV